MRFEGAETFRTLAEALLERASQRNPAVVALSGELGAGKTTLVQHIAKALGVEERVVSPTFALMKSYPTRHPFFTTLLHADAYRTNEKEMKALGFDALLARPGTLACIEWAERLEGLIPEAALRVSLAHADKARLVTFT